MFLRDVLSTLVRDGDHWRCFVPSDWMQGRTALGGLLTAFAVQAMREEVGPGVPVRSVQTAFMAPAAGELQIRCRVLRRGRSALFIEAEVHADGVLATKVLAVFGAVRASSVKVPVASAGEPAQPDASPRLGYIEGVMPEFTRHFEFRWVAGQMPFTGSTGSHTEILYRLVDPEPLDERHVVLFADAPPTPGISMLEAHAPMASMTWSLELFELPKHLDPQGFFRVRQAVERAENGYLTQTATLFAPSGEAVARSHKLVAVFG